jgi:hypothetical protein
MALPKMQTPIYNTIVPSTQQSIKFRPFLVKEEKALLIAQQSEDNNVLVDTLKSIVKSCVQDKLDVNKLAMFDLEFLLLQIRARSIGEIVELTFRCDTCDDIKARATISFDLTKMEVYKDPLHTTKLDLFDDVGVSMKYPNIDSIKKFENMDLDNIDNVFDLIIESIDYIYSGNEIYHAKEQTTKELSDFIENLTQEQFQKIKVFFETMPKLRQDIVYTCPVCEKVHNKYIEGIETFF